MIGKAISALAATTSRALHAIDWTPAVRSLRDIRVVVYHGLGDRSAPCMSSLNDEISVETFTAHMEWMQARYRFVSLEDALTSLTRETLADRPVACITFDDGLASLYTHAQPILAARQIPAAAFINTNVVGNTTLLWQHALSYLLHHHGVGKVYGEISRITGWAEQTPDSGLHVIQRCQERYGEFLRAGGVDRLCAHFAVDRSSVSRGQALYLGPSEIRELAAAGFTFYSHTASHLPLAHVDLALMRDEIDSARAAVAGLAGSSQRCISFPFGMWRDFGEAAQEYALSLGYTVLHVEDGWNPPTHVTRLKTLGRVSLGDHVRTESDLYAVLEVRPVVKGLLKKAIGRTR